jgi:hypothetical protein
MIMDPDAALADIRKMTTTALAVEPDDTTADGDSNDAEIDALRAQRDDAIEALTDLAESVAALDTWLGAGGFNPSPWSRRAAELSADHITPDVARHVLAELDDGPAQYARGGSFVRSLVDCACASDQQNLTRLGLAFPDYASAVHVWRNWPRGAALLREIAGRES